MITFTENYLKENNEFGDLEDLSFIKYAFENLKEPPNLKKDEDINCHEICKAFSKALGFKMETGHFLKGWEHSWLITQYGNIIDVYPWGTCGGPILVHRKMRSPEIYQIKNIFDSINEEHVDFLAKQIEDFI